MGMFRRHRFLNSDKEGKAVPGERNPAKYTTRCGWSKIWHLSPMTYMMDQATGEAGFDQLHLHHTPSLTPQKYPDFRIGFQHYSFRYRLYISISSTTFQSYSVWKLIQTHVVTAGKGKWKHTHNREEDRECGGTAGKGRKGKCVEVVTGREIKRTLNGQCGEII